MSEHHAPRLPSLRGAVRLALEASEGLTDVTERMHATIQSGAWPVGGAGPARTRGVTGFVYGCVRGGIRLTRKAVDAGLSVADAERGERATPAVPNDQRAFLNGAFGDYLVATDNSLATPMSLHHRGVVVDPRDPERSLRPHLHESKPTRLLILVHGLCLHEGHWQHNGHDHGAALADDHGFTPLYLRYNTGLAISATGQQLAHLLETLLERWRAPLEDLVIMGHSMGGLVTRSACHHALASDLHWVKRLTKLVFLGSPHHGAPLERAGHLIDRVLQFSPYSSPISLVSKARSAGITDLRHGRIVSTGEPVPLPPGVDCYAMAAVQGAEQRPLRDRWVGDGLVPLQSALGHHPDRERSLGIPPQQQWVGYRMDHMDLMSHPDVCAKLGEWLC
ncbi:MAG: alpha/beta hydrolase [Pseudomonadota bacterium]